MDLGFSDTILYEICLAFLIAILWNIFRKLNPFVSTLLFGLLIIFYITILRPYALKYLDPLALIPEHEEYMPNPSENIVVGKEVDKDLVESIGLDEPHPNNVNSRTRSNVSPDSKPTDSIGRIIVVNKGLETSKGGNELFINGKSVHRFSSKHFGKTTCKENSGNAIYNTEIRTGDHNIKLMINNKMYVKKISVTKGGCNIIEF